MNKYEVKVERFSADKLRSITIIKTVEAASELEAARAAKAPRTMVRTVRAL